MVLVGTLIHYHRQYYFISAWWANLHKTLSIEKPKRLPMVSASRCFLCCSFSKNAWFRKVHRKFISKVLEWKKNKIPFDDQLFRPRIILWLKNGIVDMCIFSVLILATMYFIFPIFARLARPVNGHVNPIPFDSVYATTV